MINNQKSIYLGTSGYKFDDWVGTFYPSSIKKQDMLDFYCNNFNLLEITYTYYKLPSYGVMQNILERSKGRCKFSLRLPHLFLKGKYNKEDLKTLWTQFLLLWNLENFFVFLLILTIDSMHLKIILNTFAT